MTTSRRHVLALSVAGLFVHGAARAATPKRIGIYFWMTAQYVDQYRTDLAKALREHGWTEGRDYVFDFASESWEPSPEEAAKLVRRGPHILLTSGTLRTRILQHLTQTIPIVSDMWDPVGSGFAKSIARPGGNITGNAHGVVVGKSVELLRRLVPKLRHLGLFIPANHIEIARLIIEAAKEFGITCTVHSPSDLAGFVEPFSKLAWKDGGAGYFTSWPELIHDIVKLAIEHRVASLVRPPAVDFGGLIGYEAYFADEVATTASQLNLVLRGSNPADIPFQVPTRTFLAINRSTAAALKIAVPDDLVLMANKVIE